MLQTICEVGLEFVALNLKHNLMTKFEWEMNNKRSVRRERDEATLFCISNRKHVQYVPSFCGSDWE